MSLSPPPGCCGRIAPGSDQPAAGAGRDITNTRVGEAFANCNQARAAGRAPLRRGEPGYGPHLDRDGEGIGREPWRGR